MPHGRPGVEVTAGVVPGFMLSDATYQVRGAPQGQVSALVVPDRAIGIPGLIAGARSFGHDDNTIFEPMLGYRRKLDDAISLGGVAYGTKASGEANYASYTATRVGAEVAVDARLAANSWVGVHLQAALAATVLSAQGVLHRCDGARRRLHGRGDRSSRPTTRTSRCTRWRRRCRGAAGSGSQIA